MFKKLSVLIFFGTLFFINFSEQQNSASNSFPSPSPTKTPTNKQTGVEDLILDSEKVYLPCAPGTKTPDECSVERFEVKVKTLSKDAEKNSLNYYYAVSGGEIIGQGAEVVWNLQGSRPGSYTITAGVGKNNKFSGKTLTKTVEVLECSLCGCGNCECPAIKISSSKTTVYKGETFEFSAKLNGGSQDEVTYNWTIENAMIIEGQGTSRMKVQALSDEDITATVEVGNLCADCVKTASESVKISK